MTCIITLANTALKVWIKFKRLFQSGDAFAFLIFGEGGKKRFNHALAVCTIFTFNKTPLLCCCFFSCASDTSAPFECTMTTEMFPDRRQPSLWPCVATKSDDTSLSSACVFVHFWWFVSFFICQFVISDAVWHSFQPLGRRPRFVLCSTLQRLLRREGIIFFFFLVSHHVANSWTECIPQRFVGCGTQRCSRTDTPVVVTSWELIFAWCFSNEPPVLAAAKSES